MIMIKKIQQSQQGSIALLALLITLAIAAVALSVSMVILSSLSATQDFASSTAAYYAAESGLERGLDMVADSRVKKSMLAQTFLDIKEPLQSDNMSQTFSQNNATYEVAQISNEEVDEVRFQLQPLKSQQIGLYNPDVPLSSADFESLNISWEDDCNGLSWIELTATEWSDVWVDVGASASPSSKYFYSCHHSNESPPAAENECLVQTDILDFDKSYQVKLKNNSGDCTMKNALLTVEDDEGKQKSIPSYISLDVTGTKGKTKQILSASLPWQAPVSGLFDFVLFSEKSITK